MYDFVSFQLIPKWVKRSLGTTRGRGEGGKKKKTPQELIPVKTENFTGKTLKHVDYWLNLYWAEWGLTAWVYFYLAQGPRDINDGPICLQCGGPGFDPGAPGSIPGSGRAPGEGNGNPLQYPRLENPMDGGACLGTVHGVAESRTSLSDVTFTFRPVSSSSLGFAGALRSGLGEGALQRGSRQTDCHAGKQTALSVPWWEKSGTSEGSALEKRGQVSLWGEPAGRHSRGLSERTRPPAGQRGLEGQERPWTQRGESCCGERVWICYSTRVFFQGICISMLSSKFEY